MNLKGYLEKIEAGEPINFSRFLSLLPSSLKSNYRAHFDTELVSEQRWIVRCGDSVIEQLKVISEKPKSRIDAAMRGDSHKVPVSSGNIDVFHETVKTCSPDKVHLMPGGFSQQYTPKDTLIIIENEENFLMWRHMLKAINNTFNTNYSIQVVDICLGSGNRCNSPLMLPWLRQYQSIICAFDYDRKGLEMYQSLNKKLGDKVQFLLPQDCEALLPLFRLKPKNFNQFNKAVDLAYQLNFQSLAETFRSKRKFMEQETLLKEYLDESSTE